MRTNRSLIFLVLAAAACHANSGANSSEENIPSPGDDDSGSPPPPPFLPEAGAGSDASDSGQDVPDGSTQPSCGSSKCPIGHACNSDAECEFACGYAKTCVDAPSCTNHLGGDTCGSGEVDEPGAVHESCCRTLPVIGFSDSSHPGKSVFVDKYEITSGRIRAFVAKLTKDTGKPNVRGWIASNKPSGWNDSWSAFLPTNFTGDKLTINRLLLGDPRHDGQTQEQAGPGVVLPPPTDQIVDLGINSQFGAQVYADLHGNNCGVFPGSYGFPTYYFPSDVLALNNEAARPNGVTSSGAQILAKDLLDVKSMNCITNVMLAAFCAWDGGQLATDEVLDFITASPNRGDAVSGCGVQYDNHGELLGNIFTNTVQSGGRCGAVSQVNATFDAGDTLPVPGSPLNNHVYHFPDLGLATNDKSWQIAAPGRTVADFVRISAGAEPWMDLAGNLSESVFVPSTGFFGLRFRGIGYGSSRSDLNVTLMPGETILRVQRPEAKSGLVGGRCMRFR